MSRRVSLPVLLAACHLIAMGFVHAQAAPETGSARTDRHGDPLPADAIARFGTIRFRSGFGLSFAVLSPDGKLVALNGGTDRIHLMDSATGLVVRDIPLSPPMGAMRAAFSPDGTLLATTDLTGTVQLRDVASGRLVQAFQGEQVDAQMTPAFSADGRVIAAAAGDPMNGGGACFAWEIASGRLLLKGKTLVNMNVEVALAADGKKLAAWGTHVDFGARGKGARSKVQPDESEVRNAVQLWDIQAGKELPQLHLNGPLGDVGGIAFAPDGKTIAVAERAGAVVLLNAADGKQIRQLGERSGERRVAGFLSRGALVLQFSADGKKLAVGREGVEIWETSTGKLLSAQRDPIGTVHSLVFAAGAVLACGTRGHAIDVWDAETGKVRGPANCPAGSITAIELSADARKLFTSDSIGQLSFWDVSSGATLHTELLMRGPSRVFAFPLDDTFFSAGVILSRHGKYAVHSGRLQNVRVRDLESGRDIVDLPMRNFGQLCACFSRDGTRVALAGRDFGQVAGPGAMPRHVAGNEARFESILNEGQIVEMCSAETGKVLRRFNGLKGRPHAVALSPDARWIAAAATSFDRASGPNEETCIWDAESGKQLASLSRSRTMVRFGASEPLVFSPDGKLLAVADGAGAVSFYEVTTGKKVGVLPCKSGGVGLLAFSPDGRVLAVGSGRPSPIPFGRQESSRTIQIWELASASIRKELAGHTGAATALTFADDGRLLASGSADTTAMLWDVTGQVLQPLPKNGLTAQDKDVLWRDLSSTDAARAYRAIVRLSAASEDAMALLAKMLKPVPPAPGDNELKRLARQLDSPRFTEREKAATALESAGKAAVPVLQAMLKQAPSPELRQRADRLIEQIERTQISTGGNVRSARALEVLENIKSPEARDLLKKLAQGRSDAVLTREAKAVLERLSAAR